MRLVDKREDTVNILPNKQSRYEKNSIALVGIQEIRDIAWRHAMKYRFDPILSHAHEEYLTLLNGLIKECEA